jgi:DNA-binding GntR family transcriptional regulator
MKKQGRPTPAYRELAAELRATIARNGAEARLPTEAELSQRHSLSRQTVRRAYQELVAEGVVRRIPGRGTFPAPAGPYVRSMGSLDDLVAHASDTELELLAPLRPTREPSREAVERLGTDQLMEVRLRRTHAGSPFCVSVITLPAPVGRRLSRARMLTRPGARRTTTVLELLNQVLEPPIVAARQDITVATSPADVAELIDVRPRRPMLRIDRLYFDADGTPVEYAVNYCNPERYTYRLELKRTT